MYLLYRLIYKENIVNFNKLDEKTDESQLSSPYFLIFFAGAILIGAAGAVFGLEYNFLSGFVLVIAGLYGLCSPLYSCSIVKEMKRLLIVEALALCILGYGFMALFILQLQIPP